MTSLSSRPSSVLQDPRVLLVEDSEADAYLVKRRMAMWEQTVSLEIIDSGTEAWRRLSESSPDESPRLLISGHEILLRLEQERPDLNLAKVVMSTSDDPRDIASAYAHGANGYVTKPSDLDDYEHAVDSILDFWLTVAQPRPAF